MTLFRSVTSPNLASSDPRAEFERDLVRALQRLREGRLRVQIPRSAELHRRRPRAHFHATPELFIQTGGATEFECPADRFQLRADDVCVIPRGVPHAETPVDGRRPYGVLVCMQARDGMYLHRGRADPARRIQGYGTFPLAGARLRQAFHYLDEAAARETVPREHRRRYVQALVEAFLLTALSELRTSATPATVEGSPLVVEAEKIVRTHLAKSELSVAQIARGLGCSADHLSRRFHAERGLTLGAWIVRERVALARDLLADPRYNVAEVGWACGFTTASYFIRVFRRHQGVTPRAYRLELAG